MQINIMYTILTDHQSRGFAQIKQVCIDKVLTMYCTIIRVKTLFRIGSIEQVLSDRDCSNRIYLTGLMILLMFGS